MNYTLFFTAKQLGALGGPQGFIHRFIHGEIPKGLDVIALRNEVLVELYKTFDHIHPYEIRDENGLIVWITDMRDFTDEYGCRIM